MITQQHIYIYAVASKLGPKIALFWVKTWSNFSLFFLFLFFKNPLLSAGKMRCLRKTSKKEKQKHTFFASKLGPILLRDQVLTQPWTKFWRNIFASCWVFYLFQRCRNHYIYIVFSKNVIFKPTPKNLRTLFVNTTALTFFCFCPFFLRFCFFFWFLLCPVFWGSFFERSEKNKKRQNSKQNNKKRTTR